MWPLATRCLKLDSTAAADAAAVVLLVSVLLLLLRLTAAEFVAAVAVDLIASCWATRVDLVSREVVGCHSIASYCSTLVAFRSDY